LFPADPVLGEVDLRRLGVGLSGSELAAAAVGPGCVCSAAGTRSALGQVVLIDDQQPVEELPAQGTDEPLADGVDYAVNNTLSQPVQMIGTGVSG
jgi:hypothetical protein